MPRSSKPPAPVLSLEDRRRQFIHALAEWLGGTNQARMSVQAELHPNDPGVKAWMAARASLDVFGYPSVDTVEHELNKFLGIGE